MNDASWRANFQSIHQTIDMERIWISNSFWDSTYVRPRDRSSFYFYWNDGESRWRLASSSGGASDLFLALETRPIGSRSGFDASRLWNLFLVLSWSVPILANRTVPISVSLLDWRIHWRNWAFICFTFDWISSFHRSRPRCRRSFFFFKSSDYWTSLVVFETIKARIRGLPQIFLYCAHSSLMKPHKTGRYMGKKKRSLVCDPRRKKNKRIMGSIGRSCFGHDGSGPSFDWRFILLTNELTNQRTIQVPIRSLLGHRSQAPPEVRLVSGQRVAEFRDFIARHPDVFTVSISCFFFIIFFFRFFSSFSCLHPRHQCRRRRRRRFLGLFFHPNRIPFYWSSLLCCKKRWFNYFCFSTTTTTSTSQFLGRVFHPNRIPLM